MKAVKAKIVWLVIFWLAVYTSGCGLNSTEDTMKANLRSSRTGNVLASGQAAIDLSISRPASQFRLNPIRSGVNSFISIAEGKSVEIPNDLYNTVEVFFWGDLRSTGSNVLQIGNKQSESQYFNNLDKNNFQFEISIWDYYTGTINKQTNKKYDYLGYAYFGSSRAGSLSGQGYRDNGATATVGVKFSDSLGDVIVEGTLIRNTAFPKESLFNGFINIRSPGKTDFTLGYFNNVKICKLFKCE